MWFIKAITLLLFCYVHPLIGKIYFDSRNFNNTLCWDPLETASPDEKVFYSVQYRRDDKDQFQIKKECQNITALFCDLTKETASFYDIQYIARVFANGRRYGKTTSFKPIRETIFGPPKLSILTTVSSLIVNAIMPSGPNGLSIAEIINRSTSGYSKNQIIYTLNITQPEWAAKVSENTNGSFVINLNYNPNQIEYCGYVVYKTVSEWGRSQSLNESFCAKLQDDHRILLLWILTGAALLAIIIIILLLCMWNYVKGGKQNRIPTSLVNLPIQQKVLHCRDEKSNFNKVMVCTTKTLFLTTPVKPEFPSTGKEGYSPQDIIFQDSTGSSVSTEHTLNTQDTSAQSSEMYSVVAVHVPTKEKVGIQQPNTDDQTKYNQNTIQSSLVSSGETCIKGEIGPTLITKSNVDATHSISEKPLLLDTVRSPNGQLMLTSLFSMLQSRGDDEVSPLPPENRPLLSDLIDVKIEGPSLASLQSFDSSEWSDSGCDDSNINTPTIYSDVQPNFHQADLKTPNCEAMFESGYKQNWMPGILLGPARTDY